MFYKQLSETEMKKEIIYSKEEGILADSGDLDPEIVKQVLNSEKVKYD